MNPGPLAHISVIMPVHNGIGTLNRAIESLQRQTLSGWELLAADDGSTDESYELLKEWSRRDPRIRVIRLEQNRGPSAARNAGVRYATGRMVSYLDCDDEYYPDFLGQVARLQDQADVLIFGYDYLVDGADPLQVRTWDPTPYRDHFFEGNISTPLGVAHRRELWARVGGFDESLWCQEDWDLWKRMARAGAEFLFVPLRSGLYRFRQGSLSHTHRITEHQLKLFVARCGADNPSGRNEARSVHRRPAQKVVLSSSFSYVDPTHPFGIAASGLMELLSRSGLSCEAFCSVPMIDGIGDVIRRSLELQELPLDVRYATCGSFAARVVHTRLGRVPVTLVQPHATRTGAPGQESVLAFLSFFERFLDTYRPDVLLTYTHDPDLDPLVQLAKRRDVAVAVPLFDTPFADRFAFSGVDYCLVSSEAARRRYWRDLRLASYALPPAVDHDRVRAERREPFYLTFVAPWAGCGVTFFARIVERLARLRPEIPVLVVEGGMPAPWHEGTGLDPRLFNSTYTMEAVRSPRDYYAVTKVLLAPWLGDSPLGLSVAEAMVNGIPVVASNRGSLPELVGDGGFVLDVPTGLSPAIEPSRDEQAIDSWVETIIRLWDDEPFYRQVSQRAALHAELWHPDRVGPLYADFFRAAHPQPGPPFIPA